MLNIQHLVEFIEHTRESRGSSCKGFKGWTRSQIISVIVEAFENKSAAIVFSANGQSIQGFCHGIAYPDLKIFHVSNCITDGSKGVLGGFMTILDRLYPDYKLEGQRYGRIKHYDTNRFKLKLTTK